MADEKKIAQAKTVYDTLCRALENKGWHYEKEEEKFVVHFGVNGDDIPMKMFMLVDVDRQLIRLLSPLPFNFAEDKRIDGALAVCAASYGLTNGSFDYDISDGSVTFRMVQPFDGCIIGEALFDYMISLSCSIVDKYNDTFLAINKGLVSVTDFISKE